MMRLDMDAPLSKPRDRGGRADYTLVSDYVPSGDQPVAIQALTEGLRSGQRDQVLLGVTGSGKTFTIAQVIRAVGRSALVLAPNKTLAAQLYGEMKGFFPKNAVEYFVSYYDYYQPEAYVPRSDTYIEKEATINEQIDRMRHSATRALLERKDTVIVASVSCIYGLGAVETYARLVVDLVAGEAFEQRRLLKELVSLQYKRNDHAFARGTFRVRGERIDIFPSHLEDCAWRVCFFGDEVERIDSFDPLTGSLIEKLEKIRVYANSHYVTPRPTLRRAAERIRVELAQRLVSLKQEGKLLEAQRLEQRTRFDLEMLETTGMCQGIENYSRHLTGRASGEPPPTLFEYLPEDALLIVDESHVTVPQLGGMYRGDFSRKSTLSEHGFRLPSCLDNRPLKFEEWDSMRPQTLFLSATPGDWEQERAQGFIVEQIVRPTGLIDPPCSVRPTEHQIDDLIAECRACAEKDQRVLVTTLTKRMAEDLSEYFSEAGLRVRYLHSDIDTLERIAILMDLRRGVFDILIGINLLREGLDIPECALVAILDADKEGFLRSKRSLVQTIGRAARHLEGRVILYADKRTEAMDYALQETERRRIKQRAHNEKYGITPQGVKKSIVDIIESNDKKESTRLPEHDALPESVREIALGDYLTIMEQRMKVHATDMAFERAVLFRDEIRKLEAGDLSHPLSVFALDKTLLEECLPLLLSEKKAKARRKSKKKEENRRAA